MTPSACGGCGEADEAVDVDTVIEAKAMLSELRAGIGLQSESR